jgi:hypothetical protein
LLGQVIGRADAGNAGADDDDVEMFGLCDRMRRCFVHGYLSPVLIICQSDFGSGF